MTDPIVGVTPKCMNLSQLPFRAQALHVQRALLLPLQGAQQQQGQLQPWHCCYALVDSSGSRSETPGAATQAMPRYLSSNP